MSGISAKSAVDFLLYCYFKISLEDGNKVELIEERCIKKAYDDATRQGAFNALLEKGTDKETEKNEAIKKIKHSLNELKKYDKENIEDEYRGWHTSLTERLCDIFSVFKSEIVNPAFSYGNAQKWVNMTIKNICVVYAMFETYNENCSFCTQWKHIMGLERLKFYCPIDSYVIEAICENSNLCNSVKLPIKNEQSDTNSVKKDDVKGWSQWNDEEYYSVADGLSNALIEKNSMEWENSEWIRIAKRKDRNNMDKDSRKR